MIAILLLCVVVFVIGILLMVIGNWITSRAHGQLAEMYAERIEHLDRFEQVEAPPAHNDPTGYLHRRNG